jgi:hypothetical protein
MSSMTTCGQPEGNGMEGAVVGHRLLSREAVRRSHGAQGGGDEAGGGSVWANIVEVLGSGVAQLGQRGTT